MRIISQSAKNVRRRFVEKQVCGVDCVPDQVGSSVRLIAISPTVT
jgi:hypothetical protein